MTNVVAVDKVHRDVAVMTDAAEVTEYAAELAAIERYARKQGLDKGRIRRLQKAQRDALIRLGELLAEMDERGERAGLGDGAKGCKAAPLTTLADMGITKKLSHRAQLIARWARGNRESYEALFAAHPEEDSFSESLVYNSAWRWAHGNGIISNEPPEVPAGEYACIVIDPPWPYEMAFNEQFNCGGLPYPALTIEALAAMSIPAADDCIVWLWTTNAFVHEAYHLLSAWGFEDKTIMTWVKPGMGLGRWLRGQTEHCILAIRGKPKIHLTNQTTVLHAPRREHSRKPDEFFHLVEELCSGPRLEMFAREPRDGWEAQGNETGKFARVNTATTLYPRSTEPHHRPQGSGAAKEVMDSY